MQRVENIRRIINENFGGNQSDFAKTIQKAPAQVNQWLNGRRNIGDGVAVQIEQKLGLPIGTLDRANGSFSIINSGTIHTQNNVAGDQYNNHFVSEDEAVAQPNAHFYTAMPILGIDDAVEYALNPKEKGERIKDTAERAATFIPHTDRTFAVKVANNRLTALSQPTIQLNDILIIEPKIPPRDQDLVLICLDYQQATQRGMVARLFIDLRGQKTIKYAETDAEPMPAGALICGVVVEVKRRLLPNDLVASRIDAGWDIRNTLTN